jgi:tryptophan-rich sensory protein
VITSLLGTLLHFLYEWTGEAVWSAPISGVNESTWEHMKLFFFPAVAFAVFESFFMRERRDFWCIKLRGITLGLVLIPVIYYTYNGAIEKSPDWLNISIFFISAAVAFIYEARQMRRREPVCTYPKIAVTVLCVLSALFVIFTFAPPEIGIFMDPVSGEFGI